MHENEELGNASVICKKKKYVKLKNNLEIETYNDFH